MSDKDPTFDVEIRGADCAKILKGDPNCGGCDLMAVFSPRTGDPIFIQLDVLIDEGYKHVAKAVYCADIDCSRACHIGKNFVKPLTLEQLKILYKYRT